MTRPAGPHPAAADEIVRDRLSALERRGLMRELTTVEGVDLCSNDYLALRDHDALRRAVAESCSVDGGTTGAGASRLLSGNLPAHEAFERRLASWLDAEAALLFGTGWMAGYGVCSTVPQPGDVVFSDALNHACLIDGLKASGARRIVFPHRDHGALSALMERERPDAGGSVWLVTESLFSMDGTVAPFDEYAALLDRFGGAAIVDEAHAAGILGPEGRGLAHGFRGRCAARIVTFGKAFGSQGAAVVSSSAMRSWLINACRTFIYTTALAPTAVAAARAALELIEREPERRERLAAVGHHLRARCREAGFDVPSDVGPIVPVVLGDVERTMAAAEALQGAGYFVRAVRPPTVPDGTARLRFSVTARHDDETIDRAVDVLIDALDPGEDRP